MKVDCNINIHHLTRVEGHGNIRIKIHDGKLQEAKWEVVETPRFLRQYLSARSGTMRHGSAEGYAASVP